MSSPEQQQYELAEKIAGIARFRRFGTSLAGCEGWLDHALPILQSQLLGYQQAIFNSSNNDPAELERYRQRWFALKEFFEKLQNPVFSAFTQSIDEQDPFNGRVPAQILTALSQTAGKAPVPSASAEDSTKPEKPLQMPENPTFDPFASPTTNAPATPT